MTLFCSDWGFCQWTPRFGSHPTQQEQREEEKDYNGEYGDTRDYGDKGDYEDEGDYREVEDNYSGDYGYYDSDYLDYGDYTDNTLQRNGIDNTLKKFQTGVESNIVEVTTETLERKVGGFPFHLLHTKLERNSHSNRHGRFEDLPLPGVPVELLINPICDRFVAPPPIQSLHLPRQDIQQRVIDILRTLPQDLLPPPTEQEEEQEKEKERKGEFKEEPRSISHSNDVLPEARVSVRPLSVGAVVTACTTKDCSVDNQDTLTPTNKKKDGARNRLIPKLPHFTPSVAVPNIEEHEKRKDSSNKPTLKQVVPSLLNAKESEKKPLKEDMFSQCPGGDIKKCVNTCVPLPQLFVYGICVRECADRCPLHTTA